MNEKQEEDYRVGKALGINMGSLAGKMGQDLYRGNHHIQPRPPRKIPAPQQATAPFIAPHRHNCGPDQSHNDDSILVWLGVIALLFIIVGSITGYVVSVLYIKNPTSHWPYIFGGAVAGALLIPALIKLFEAAIFLLDTMVTIVGNLIKITLMAFFGYALFQLAAYFYPIVA